MRLPHQIWPSVHSPLTPLHAEVSCVAKVLCLCRALALKLEHDRLAAHVQAECSTGWNTAVRMAAHPAGKFVVLGVGPAGLVILELCKADDGTMTLELVQLSGAACVTFCWQIQLHAAVTPRWLPQPCLCVEAWPV